MRWPAALVAAVSLLASCGGSGPARTAAPPPPTTTPSVTTAPAEATTSTASGSAVSETVGSPPANDVEAASPPRPDAFGSTPPSDAALASARDAAAVPPGALDCGQDVPTWGWPTTAVLRPDRWDCIVDAAATGTPALYSVLARDHSGGVDLIVYEVVRPGQARIVTEHIDGQGTVDASTDEPCAGFDPPPDTLGAPRCANA
jgi:hypothetical protein